jgi:hypothetical protein
MRLSRIALAALIAVLFAGVRAAQPVQAQAAECFSRIPQFIIITIPEIDLSEIDPEDLGLPPDFEWSDGIPVIPSQTIKLPNGSTEEFDPGCFGPGDDRVNPDNNTQAAIYCRPQGVAIWSIDVRAQGHFEFLATRQLIESIPADLGANALVAEYHGFRLYALTSGELQLNTPPNWENKEYVFTWSGCDWE